MLLTCERTLIILNLWNIYAEQGINPHNQTQSNLQDTLILIRMKYIHFTHIHFGCVCVCVCVRLKCLYLA